jgi:hypothetical protein
VRLDFQLGVAYQTNNMTFPTLFDSNLSQTFIIDRTAMLSINQTDSELTVYDSRKYEASRAIAEMSRLLPIQ